MVSLLAAACSGGAAMETGAGGSTGGGATGGGGATTTTTTTDPRQALRDASIFVNLDFEDVDATGAPTGWTCLDVSGKEAACQLTTARVEHGQRALVLPSGWYAYQTTKTFDAAQGVRFDYFAEGAAVMPMDTWVYAADGSGNVLSRLYVDGLPTVLPGFTDVPSRGAAPTAGATSLALILHNSMGSNDYDTATNTVGPDGPDLVIDDLIAVQDQENPPPKVGSLVRGTHLDMFSLSASSTPASIYLPLPIDWASQTPLDLELTVTPASIVDHISYATEAENNWGATIHFVAGAAAASVVVRWDGVVLDQAVADADLPTVFAAVSPPTQWLSSSGVIESSDPDITSTATGLVPSGSGALDTMLGVLAWTSSNITYGFAGGLDATTVFDTKEGTCTGFANLAAAMGRDLGVPTRHVTNMLVGDSQDMHSINEFYLGAQLGWRRVEPQASAARVPDDYGLIMRLTLPSDESPLADRSSPAGPLTIGIPEREFTESLTAPGAIHPSAALPNVFTDCNLCRNRADPQSDLRDTTPATMKAVFASARAHWQTTLATYQANGGISSAEAAVRKQAKSARTLADVQALVNALP